MNRIVYIGVCLVACCILNWEVPKKVLGIHSCVHFDGLFLQSDSSLEYLHLGGKRRRELHLLNFYNASHLLDHSVSCIRILHCNFL